MGAIYCSEKMATGAKTEVKNQTLGPWNVVSSNGPILKSTCKEDGSHDKESCPECCFGTLKLPLPEMVFGRSFLLLQHADGFGIEFNALEALKLVDDEHDLMKVPGASEWQAERKDVEEVGTVSQPYDWTYTTGYRGSLICRPGAKPLNVVPTDQQLDLERLRVREKILFFDEVVLFEDELADNGTAQLSVKIRCMPSGFFILQRFFLRVDRSIIRVHDTRLHYVTGEKHILREFCVRQNDIQELKLPRHMLTDRDYVADRLTVREVTCERLELPSA